MSGQVPRRVDAATKTGLLELLDEATDEGWSLRRACRQLELGELRAYRWLGRRDTGELEDARPGGSPMHGLLEEEATQIVVLSMSGVRPTGPTASSRTVGPTCIGCGCHRRRCVKSLPHKGFGSAPCLGRGAASGRLPGLGGL